MDEAVAQAKADVEPDDIELYSNVYSDYSQIPKDFRIRPADPFAQQVPINY